MSKQALPETLYLAAQVRELDRLAIEELKIPGFTLMQRAGQAAFSALMDTWPQTKALIAFCGNGNNGGDGFIIAGLAKQQGIHTTVFHLGDPAHLKPDARRAYAFARSQAVPMQAFTGNSKLDPAVAENGVIVDALLGTGVSGEIRGPYRHAIDTINASGLPVLAVDIPSGLSSDSGEILGAAVNAQLTVTFIAMKKGMVRAEGPGCCGRIVFDDLGVPPAVFAQLDAAQASDS